MIILVYGYFFNKSTETIVEASFAERKAKEAFKDLTANLQQKVEEQTKYLKELLEMKTDFLRVVNHQLNTPLAVMKGYFSMMEEGSCPPAKAKVAIKGGLERLSSTVSDFWDAYELEGEKMQMEPQEVNLAEIIDNLIPEKQKLQLAVERKLKISVEKSNFSAKSAVPASDGKIPSVWCDRQKISHVISNLLDNAVYYTRQGSVTVSYELDGKDFLKISVKDTGAGISEADKKKLFQKFSRGQNATNLRPDGSGLGLFIAKKIVEDNHGKMFCSSDGVDQGSTFSFTLPIYKNQKKEPGEEQPVNREQKIVIFDKNN